MNSIWEQRSLLEYEVIIIGGGITGLSVAASLAEQDPSLRIAVLERGTLPTGASTRNAGFACFGSVSELYADIKNFGEDTCKALVQDRWEGLKILRDRLSDKAIGYDPCGGYELLRVGDLHYFQKMEVVNTLLHPIFDKQVFSDKSKQIKDFGFNPNTIKGLIFNPLEGALDSGLMMDALWRYVSALGVRVITGATVVNYEETPTGVLIRTNHCEFKTNTLALCTNAFTPELTRDIKLEPGRGLVLATRPLQKIPFRGTFHIEEGYYYFRDLGNQILIGGGRNLDFEHEATTEMGINEKILDRLKTLLEEEIIPEVPWEIDMTWSGIMAFGETRKPVVSALSDRVFAGVRMGGMGVAIGSKVGAQLAGLILEHKSF